MMSKKLIETLILLKTVTLLKQDLLLKRTLQKHLNRVNF